jgi:hypothetical protein
MVPRIGLPVGKARSSTASVSTSPSQAMLLGPMERRWASRDRAARPRSVMAKRCGVP